MSKLVFVVKYGDGVSADSQTVKVEWCPERNIDKDGKPKTRFYADGESPDHPYFLINYDPSKVRIDRVAATDGMVSSIGEDSQDREDELLFTSDETVSLSYFPAGSLEKGWRGNVGQGLVKDGDELFITSGWPCSLKVSYPVDFLLYRLFAPADIAAEVAEATDDEEEKTYTIYIVVYVEDAE